MRPQHLATIPSEPDFMALGVYVTYVDITVAAEKHEGRLVVRVESLNDER